MKTYARIVAFGVGLASVVLVAVDKEKQAVAAEIPTHVAAAPNPSTNAAPPGATPVTLEKPALKNANSNADAASTNEAAGAAMPTTLTPTPALAEVVRLLQSGVSEEVLLAYITNSTETFNIGADEILYLHDLGAPTTVITSLIQRDASPEMMAQKQALAAAQPLPAGFALNKPATNLYAAQAPAPVGATPQPTPVSPPSSVASPTPPETYAPPVMEQPENIGYFYDELAPYGSWVDISGYGRCWRPTIAVWNSGWRPYADGGHWLWSNCGWYWYSDYSWGWAPFHYGRWTCPNGIGWVWVPGTCWGPAWVSWRYSSAYCGWAPLPPSAHFVLGHGFFHNGISVGIGFNWNLGDHDFVFVPTGHFCDTRPSRFYLSHNHAATVFKETTVVNNYVTVNKTTVVNHGVGFDRIASATRGNIRQVALKGTTDIRNTNPRRETLASDGRTLTVSQPPVSPPAVAGSKPAVTTSHFRPRTERITGVAPAPIHDANLVARDTPSLRQATRLESPDSIPARPTFVTPRTAGDPLRPASGQPIGRPMVPKPGQGTVIQNGIGTAPGTAGLPAAPPRTSRVQPPVIARRTQPVPENNVAPSSPNFSSTRTLPGRGEPTRSFNPPGPIRPPTAPAPDIAPARPAAPAFIPPAARPSVPLSPRGESYRVAPAPSAAPSAAPRPAPAPAPAARSSGEGAARGRSSLGK